MSYERIHKFTCDGKRLLAKTPAKHQEPPQEVSSGTKIAAWRQLKFQGWTMHMGRYLCPACAAELARQSKE